MLLSRETIVKTNQILLHMFKNNVPEYGLRDCTIMHLSNRDTIYENGKVAVGSINGGALMKYMTKEVFDHLRSIDPTFATPLDTTYRGKRVKLLVCWLSTDRGNDKAVEFWRCCFGPNNDEYCVKPDRKFASKPLTWKQFQKWQEKFKFHSK